MHICRIRDSVFGANIRVLPIEDETTRNFQKALQHFRSDSTARLSRSLPSYQPGMTKDRYTMLASQGAWRRTCF